MANKRMLIDSAHPEETRVAVMDGNQLEELDVESSARRQLKGNIYLAKVTRVEPSLQAAFVDYGGNRHGFLAFGETHPDYYQIPVADREQLIAEDEEARAADTESDDDVETENSDEVDTNSKAVETVGGDDIDEVEDQRRLKPVRRYKIQEVIKRRQILLVQVVKEERGNKGAALTTYLSLAGRYCVLMPNTGKGGGISRRIGGGADRRRLKSVVSSLDIPEGMAVIVRTAGAERSRAEIKRDFEYLIRLWGNVRELTLESTAPALIHEEANIIKRALRDMYTRDVSEILIEGEKGYRVAKDLMKLLMPSHAKKVQPYKDTIVPLFSRHQIENQLEAMLGQEVKLKSGGYIVINATEALVAVDVNSGRATRGRNIEETALKTNLEAALEVARQVRLRDLAGLVVIDFIDMDLHRNQTAVERRLKEAMRRDRAKIQIGRISPFGLLELSRQRMRPSIAEITTDTCPHCNGSGIRRSTESTALHVLRGIEEEGGRHKATEIEVTVPIQAALYMLNHKREALAEIEKKFNLKVKISEDNSLIPPHFSIERLKLSASNGETEFPPDKADSRYGRGASNDEPKKRRRRRPRHGKKGEPVVNEIESSPQMPETEHANSSKKFVEKTSEEDREKPKKRRRVRRKKSTPMRSQKLNSTDLSSQKPTAAEGQILDTPVAQFQNKTEKPPITDSPDVEKSLPVVASSDTDMSVTVVGSGDGEKSSESNRRGWWKKLVD